MEQYIGYIVSPYNDDEIIESVRLSLSNELIEIEFSASCLHYLDLPYILGTFNGLGKVTFFKCQNSGSSSGSGASQKKYSAQFLFIGDYLPNPEDKYFEYVQIAVKGLYSWTKISSIINDVYESKTIRIEDSPNILIYSCNDYIVELYSNVNYSFKRKNNEISLKENVGIKILSKNRVLNVWEYLELLREFQKLFFILGNVDTQIDKVFFCDGSDYPVTLNWHGYKAIGLPSPTNLALQFHDIVPELQSIITNWINKKELQTSIDLILEKSKNSDLSVENYFLNNCFAIETLHRRYMNFRIFDESEFKSIKKKILEDIENIEVKEILSNNLAHINEPNFRRRLKDFSEIFNKVLPGDFELDQFITRVVKTRNFLVHRSSDKNTFAKFEMLYAAIFIEIIVKVNIYRLLEIKEPLIDNALQSTSRTTIAMYEFNKHLSY
jgi:hypothetical protein